MFAFSKSFKRPHANYALIPTAKTNLVLEQEISSHCQISETLPVGACALEDRRSYEEITFPTAAPSLGSTLAFYQIQRYFSPRLQICYVVDLLRISEHYV